MKWIRVLETSQLLSETRQVVEVKGESLLILQHREHVYAVSNACPHMGVSLKRGQITEEGEIVCPVHHSRFSLATGEVKEWSPWPPVVGKMMGAIKQEHELRTYPTKIEGGGIWVGIEEGDDN